MKAFSWKALVAPPRIVTRPRGGLDQRRFRGDRACAEGDRRRVRQPQAQDRRERLHPDGRPIPTTTRVGTLTPGSRSFRSKPERSTSRRLAAHRRRSGPGQTFIEIPNTPVRAVSEGAIKWTTSLLLWNTGGSGPFSPAPLTPMSKGPCP